MRRSVALVLIAFVFPPAAASCSSGGRGGFAALDDDGGGSNPGDARADGRRDARDSGETDDDPGTDEDAALPKLDASKTDAVATDAKVDSSEGGLPSGQCFDVGL